MIGKTLGHYEITSQLGKGGMGEVFQAKDHVLGRDVAIKVLPEEFAKDADRVARFQREAKLLASLNHPNIAAIYGLEESGGTNFLVLELVEGETLADRIKQGPIPVEDCLKLALQIAEALEAAHEKGVIHRDLKPANIKVTPDGKVKILDFGLAKAFAGEQQEMVFSNSPTLSAAATQQGIILGTAANMSPEQAKGKAVDKRSDIWAFGAVLFEMLTGKPAFPGEEVSEILASVIKGDVKLDLLPPNIHPRVREVIIRCLQKDLRRRYSGIADARYEIEQALADPGGGMVKPVTAVEPRSRLRTILPWAAAALVLGLIIAGAAVWKFKPAEPRQVTRLYYELPKDQQFGHPLERAIAVSPDGRRFVYSTSKGLYLCSVNEWDARFIAGSEGGQSPFFSPDGMLVGYWSPSDRKLKKIAIGGGAPVPIADADLQGIAAWETNDTILFGQREKGILRVSANGGIPELIIKAADGESLMHPKILPDGKSVLFSVTRRGPEGRLLSLQVAVQSLESSKRKVLLESAAFPQYLGTGHLLCLTTNGLIAAPFDPDKLELTGGRISIAEKIHWIGLWPQYSVSDSGTFVYVPDTAASSNNPQRSLVWVDRNGKEEPLTFPQNAYTDPRISPDGMHLAVNIFAGEKRGIWAYDLARASMTRLTSEKVINMDISPLWTSDGQKITYLSFREASYSLNWKAANGTGKEELLSTGVIVPASWSRDGKTLVAMRAVSMSPSISFEIGTLLTEGDREWKPLLQEKHNERQPRISPDGRWMAYASDESGQEQIYVCPFPDVTRNRWTVSTSGGYNPLWSPDGRELFYRSGNAVVAVPLKTEPTLVLGAPKILIDGAYAASSRFGWPEQNTWDISGKRFLMMKESGSSPSEAGGPQRINVVLNWLEELKQKVPVK